MDNSALPPEDFTLNAEPIKDIEEEAINVAQDEDIQLASLKGMTGWERIAKDMRQDIDDLARLRKVDMGGISISDVGERFLVASGIAAHLEKYLDKVENAAKAVADAERSKLK